MSLLSFCQWLADTPGSIALHESLFMYPLVESVHVLTLCVFVGMSTGAITWVALQIARELGTGHRVAMIAPDSGARYLSTTLFAIPEPDPSP